MACFSCGISPVFKTLSRAAAKAVGARLRGLGARRAAPNWTARAATCERCPLRVVHRHVSYCGSPLLHQVIREPSVDGCGCPTHAKARDPDEHCPLTARFLPASRTNATCTCRWCAIDPGTDRVTDGGSGIIAR